MSKSNKIVIEAPMSFSGSLQRLNNWFWIDQPIWLMLTVSWWLMPTLWIFWWALIIPWYLIFGIWLIPYRAARQDQRRRRKEHLERQEYYQEIRAFTREVE